MGLKKSRATRSSMIHKQVEELDLISELPEFIIHHIMSFMPPKDAARVSALGKRFRSAWKSFPFIVLDETLELGSFGKALHGRARIDEFLNYVSDFLQHRPPNISLEKFGFCVKLCEGYDKPNHHIDGAINYAIENHVKELELEVGKGLKFNAHYRFPLSVLSAKSIRVLKLIGFKLNSGQEDFMLSHPFVESLSMRFITGMKSLKVSCQKLKILEIYLCKGLKKMEVIGSNLESFSFSGVVLSENLSELCDINVAACNSLKYLSLRYAKITVEWIQSHIPNFLLLENLKLKFCSPLEILYVSCANLKTLELNNCSELQKIEVVAPNLEYFYCMGGRNDLSLIDIGACRSLKDLELSGAGIEGGWLETTLLAFPFLKNLLLSSCSGLQEFMIFNEKLENLKLIDCNALKKVEIFSRSLNTFVYTAECPNPPMFSFYSTCFNAILSLSTAYNRSSNWFSELRDFLVSFGHCRELQITCEDIREMFEDFTVPRDLRDSLLPPLCDLKLLKMHTSYPIMNNLDQLEDLMDSLLWLAPNPYTITIVSGPNEKSLKFEFDIPLPVKLEDLPCCYSMPVKCWRHHLKQFTMEEFTVVEKEVLQKFIAKEAPRLEATYDN